MIERAVLLVNGKSRRGKQWFRLAQTCLRDQGVALERAQAFTNPAALPEAVAQAVRDKVDAILVGGGDGTFSQVAGIVADEKATLGLLPFGTGNSFARDLEIPADVEAACKVIAEGVEANVDLGLAEESYFVNVATVGLTTRIAEELTVESKRRFGRFVYAIALFKAVARCRPFRATLETEGSEVSFDTLQVVVGNGRFHAGPFPLAPEASITDGLLHIYALASTRKSDLFRLAFSMPGGRHVALEEVASLATKRVRLETVPRQAITLDGEIVQRTPKEFRSLERSLRVFVPADFLATAEA